MIHYVKIGFEINGVHLRGFMALPKKINEFITDLYNTYKDTQIASKEDRAKSMELIIEEQHRDYDYLLHIYNRMRATESVLLTAVFGIVAYLYYKAPVGSKTSITDRLFIPSQDYGKVIYSIAAGFFVYGLLKLMLNVFGKNPWMTAYETVKTNYTYKYIETLEYIKNRYDACYEFNSKGYAKRKNELEFLFYCILISATILIVIKTLK